MAIFPFHGQQKMPKEGRQVGKITKTKTKAKSTVTLTRKSKRYHQITIKTLKEQNQFYRQLFESQGIPYITGVAIDPIINSERSSEISFVQKSILCPLVLEPPIHFEACRIVTKLEYQFMERPEVLSPPFASSIPNTQAVIFEEDMPQERSPISDKDSTTSSSSEERKSDKKPRKTPERERLRHKFSSDKNHELSDNEDNSTMAGIPGSSPDAYRSPRPAIPIHTDDQGDSGIGMETPISPSSDSSNSTTTTDRSDEGVPDKKPDKTELEAASKQMPPPPIPKATSPQQEPVEVKEELLSSPNDDMDDFNKYEDDEDDLDILIIDVSDVESNEF